MRERKRVPPSDWRRDPYGMSSCHQALLVQEPIYLVGAKGLRDQIGHVVICTGQGADGLCQKPNADPVRHRGGGGFYDHEWALMMKIHPKPPYYFQRSPFGGLVPEGHELTKAPDYPTGQDLAAGDAG